MRFLRVSQQRLQKVYKIFYELFVIFLCIAEYNNSEQLNLQKIPLKLLIKFTKCGKIYNCALLCTKIIFKKGSNIWEYMHN